MIVFFVSAHCKFVALMAEAIICVCHTVSKICSQNKMLPKTEC